MKHWASYNLLPLSSRQFYAIVIQNWTFIITAESQHDSGSVYTLLFPQAPLFGSGLAASGDLHVRCKAGSLSLRGPPGLFFNNTQ